MYNILWMDDDFIGPDPTNSDDIINARREGFLDDVAQAKQFDLEIDPALDIDEFKKKFSSNPDKYQAVILDIMDLNPNDSRDESALAEALRLVEKTCILTYVYSNNPDKPGHRDYIKVHIPADHAISKAGNVCDNLYTKIISDLNDANSCFNGHKECLDLLNEGYLSTYGQMKTLLKNIDDDTYLPFNDMRQILENMLETLTQSGVIPKTKETDTHSTFNKRMDYLTKYCKEKNETGKKKINWDEPCFPYSDCRHEIKWVLDFMGNITNRYSHYQHAKPNYLLNGDLLLEYNNSIRKIVYEAFFVSMKWYYGYISKRKRFNQ